MLDELVRSFQQNTEDSFTFARIIQSSFDEDAEEEKESFSLYIHPGRFRGDYPLGLRFRPLSDVTMDSSCISYRRVFTCSTNTQESKSLVAYWLDVCEQKHINVSLTKALIGIRSGFSIWAAYPIRKLANFVSSSLRGNHRPAS